MSHFIARELAVTQSSTIATGDLQENDLHADTFVDHVIFLIGPENYRSQRAVEKLGAVRAGTRIDGYGRERLAFEISAAMFNQPISSRA